jgi:hypothetical protein
MNQNNNPIDKSLNKQESNHTSKLNDVQLSIIYAKLFLYVVGCLIGVSSLYWIWILGWKYTKPKDDRHWMIDPLYKDLFLKVTSALIIELGKRQFVGRDSA